MRLMICAFLAFVFVAPLQAKEWRVGLCYGDDATGVDKQYRRAIGDVVASNFHTVDKESKVTVKVRDCVEEPDFACYADKEAIFCREEPLALLVRTSACLSAEAAFIYQSQPNARALEIGPKLGWADALRLADAESDTGDERFKQYADIIMENKRLSADSLNAIYSLVVDLYKYTNTDLEPDKDNTHLSVGLDIYRAVNEYVFAFVLGHEAYHFNANTCPITEKLPIETNGYWKEIYQLQHKGGLFDPKITLDTHELRADRCGYRWMGLTAKNHQGTPVVDALSKRIAIDVLATPMFAGLLKTFDENKIGHEVPVMKLADGYLYPQSRLALAALVLNSTEKHYPSVVKACNDTSRALVTTVQESASNFPKTSGYVPDSFMAALPPAVEVAWNNGIWTEESHSCFVGDEK